MTTRIKATELSHVVETEPGKLEEIIVRVGDTFTLAESPDMHEALRRDLGPHKITGFAPASYKNRVIAAPASVEVPEYLHALWPLDIVAASLTKVKRGD